MFRCLVLLLTLCGAAYAQSRVEYNLYRPVSVNSQTQLLATRSARPGETLLLMAVLTVERDAEQVTVVLPLPPSTTYAGDLNVPLGTGVSFSESGATFTSSPSTNTRYVRVTFPYAVSQTTYRIDFKIIVRK